MGVLVSKEEGYKLSSVVVSLCTLFGVCVNSLKASTPLSRVVVVVGWSLRMKPETTCAFAHPYRYIKAFAIL